MVTTQPASKRPICPLCSKPVRLCLCTRIQNPGLHNSVVESRETQKLDFEYCDEVSAGKGNMGDMSSSPNRLGDVDFVEKEHEFSIEEFTNGRNVDGQCNVDEGSATIALPAVSRAIAATIGKHGVISSLSHIWMPRMCEDKNFDTILDIAEARNALAEGFVVQKLQKPLKGSVELDECVEFEVEVPPGSVLLFPSEEVVNNLIVLDGTWAKAKRMHGENPWLKLLPHFKLNLDKMSLHSEVRLQPKPDFCPPLRALFMP
ncbi:hypothetical protein D8674_022257 [Pyrus ussuriensis x Pyrus communis]|uniref:tRNA-uridine aminocarboxypropyltransferase n=1 Tax=Pyrus ussuriensis x Pyrus communis TaxID=2448454 RepID=A0A5N5GJI0_9ROSA|nr:hypothetical protein D8674_022257 [Pyrus ussuriensis x Pyrus communis]